jgi:tetratricopeptide (TPR) repeat protein
MLLVWAARWGVTEAELLDLLGGDREPLPRSLWSPLYLATERTLLDRSGMIVIGHEYLREAVRARYLPGEEDRRHAHLRLADYFACRDLGPRKVDELPWQLMEAGAWERLQDLLADLGFLIAARRLATPDVQRYWAMLERRSPGCSLIAYRAVLDSPPKDIDGLDAVSDVLDETGHPDGALALREHGVARCRRDADDTALQASLGRAAAILISQGRLAPALDRLREREALCRRLRAERDLASCYHQMADVLYRQGELASALALLNEVMRIQEEEGDDAGEARTLQKLSVLWLRGGDITEALRTADRCEQVCRTRGDLNGASSALEIRGMIHLERHEYAAASGIFDRTVTTWRELGHMGALASALNSQGVVRARLGEKIAALSSCEEAEVIARQFGTPADIIACILNRATVLGLDPARSLQATETGLEALSLVPAEDAELQKLVIGWLRRLKGHMSGHLGRLLAEERTSEATNLLRAQERICRRIDDHDGLVSSMMGRAMILFQQAETKREALELANQAYALAEARDPCKAEREWRVVIDVMRMVAEDGTG